MFAIVCASMMANGHNGAECPAICTCSALDSYVNSREVKCSYRGLSDVPAMLNLSTVHTLDLSDNQIRIMRNASLFNYSRLSTLILSYNEVEEIELNAFVGLGMLRDIDLSYNNLVSFNPEIFSSNPVLEKVSLKGNRLAYLSPDSPILTSDSVYSLDLSSCSLTTIPAVTFSGLPSLYSLDLSSNLIQTVSVSTFENLTDLTILEMNNNRWTCSCDVVEVMKWATARREQQPAHKPVKCLEGQKYRKLWTMAGGNRSCSETKTTVQPVAHRFTAYMTLDVTTVSGDIPLSLETSPRATSQRGLQTKVTSEAKFGAASGSETGDWANLLSWNVNTAMVFVILPITLCGAVFVSLLAVNCITKRFHRPQREVQGKDNHLAAFFSDVPLLDPQLTADITKQVPCLPKRSSDIGRYTQYHVYEQIE